MKKSFRRSVRADLETTLDALREAAELWSAAWKDEDGGGLLHLPVLAGIRRGRILARVDATAEANGCSVELSVESADYEINRTAVLILSLGGLGGLALILWPLAPARLLGFVPLGIVFMVVAWLAVASKVRTAGVDDFLDTVAELAENDAEPPAE